MNQYAYRIVNVFGIGTHKLSGNPLCVFEDARGLDDAVMQALALQFNLSETTFVLPSATAHAQVRVFTPTFEMPFAGHPTLGTAHVVGAMQGLDAVNLEMKIGIVPVHARGQRWTLQAQPPKQRNVEANRAQLAEMLCLSATDLADRPLWMNTGSEQLLVPLRSLAAVERARPTAELLMRYASAGPGRYLVYVWTQLEQPTLHARFFFSKGSSVVEDPATGSACANLGGWFIASKAALPIEKTILQGSQVDRASSLSLQVAADERISVSGEVIELGRGFVEL